MLTGTWSEKGWEPWARAWLDKKQHSPEQ